MFNTPKVIKSPGVQILDAESPYAVTQTSDTIADGDVLIVPTHGVVAVMVAAWPTVVYDSFGHGVDRFGFHTLAAGTDPACIGAAPAREDIGLPADPGTDYSASWALAGRVAWQ